MKLESAPVKATVTIVQSDLNSYRSAQWQADRLNDKPRSTAGVFFLAAVKGPGILYAGIFLEVFFVVDQRHQAIGILNDVVFLLDSFGQQKSGASQ